MAADDLPSISGRHPVKFANVAVAATGDTVIAPAPGPTFRIRVIHYALVSADAKTIQFKSGSGGATATGVMTFGANGEGYAYSHTGLFELAENTALAINCSTAGVLGGSLSYIEVM